MKKIVLYILCLIIFQSCSTIIKFKNLPKTTGQYIIGTDIFEFEDNSRNEYFTEDSDDLRKILVQVWYPAIAVTDSIYPYLDNDEIRIPEIAKQINIPSKLIKNISKIKTNAYYKAKPINKTFPVIIFSHGLGGTKIQNSINVEALVSNGYIVFALDHPYDANITIFENGDIAKFDAYLPDNTTEEEFWKVRLPHINTRADDISFLINRLEKLKKSNFLIVKNCDLNNIGVFGHTFGGGTSILSSYKDDRISACINLDGWLEPVPNYVINEGLEIPFCYIGQIQKYWDGAKFNEQRLYKFHENSTKSTIIEIKGTTHFDYSDSPYFNRMISRLYGVSNKEGKNIAIDLSDIIVNYFDYYLKNNENKWMEPITNKYEVKLKKNEY